ncbi:MAG: hypothetical protein ACREWG_00800, partial [Gammaproteobacteria bacterium]
HRAVEREAAEQRRKADDLRSEAQDAEGAAASAAGAVLSAAGAAAASLPSAGPIIAAVLAVVAAVLALLAQIAAELEEQGAPQLVSSSQLMDLIEEATAAVIESRIEAARVADDDRALAEAQALRARTWPRGAPDWMGVPTRYCVRPRQ